MKVVVLMGGRSSEREISLRTGHGIALSLRNLGHEVTAIDAADGRTIGALEKASAQLEGPFEHSNLPEISINPSRPRAQRCWPHSEEHRSPRFHRNRNL